MLVLKKMWVIGRYTVCLTLLFGIACMSQYSGDEAELERELPDKVDFNFHIRPLLADRCYACHGPDDQTREAGLRLDTEVGAFGQLDESKGHAIVKGSLSRSVAWQRITEPDPEKTMPPPESHLSLSDVDKALIKKWIEQGAEWKDHWAFIPPQKAFLPDSFLVKSGNPIDFFIQQKLAEKGLSPSPEVGKERLIRRLFFDVTGLPPSLEEVDAFLADSSEYAYANLVDHLLKTEAHAERLALDWLDVARFGDTQGLHVDPERYNWPWRDWVISAFHRNMPYDEFITWQMAGDLLPQATREQKLATAFHRNHPTSSEGGIPDEEFRQKYVQDRTNTTATAFLGLTLECAACHDHKFDPISQREYYQFSAFFNNLKEVGMVNEYRVKQGGSGPVYASGPSLLLPEKDTERELHLIERGLESLKEEKQLLIEEVLQTKEFLEFAKDPPILAPQADSYFPFNSIEPYTPEHAVVHRIQGNAPIHLIVDQNEVSLASGKPELVNGKIGKALYSPKEVDLVFLNGEGSYESYDSFSGAAWVSTEKTGEFQTIFGNSGAMGNAWRGWDFFLDTLNRPAVSLVSVRPQNYLQVIADPSIEMDKWYHLAFTYDGSMEAGGLNLYVNGKKVPIHIEYDNLYGTIKRRWRKRGEWEERPLMVFRSGRYHTGENGVFTGKIDEVQLFNRCLSTPEIQVLYEQQEEVAPSPSQSYSRNFMVPYLLQKDSTYQEIQNRQKELLVRRTRLLEEVPEIMVMEDRSEVRPTFLLDRGQYNAPKEEVFVGTPQAVMPFPVEAPPDRLGLARWLTNEKNPLTARVAVNRYWQLIFGKGLVDTPHDFGTQGALPSHPDLLDWLAVNFMETGWNVRDLLKLMLTSQTYKQSSLSSEVQRERDPNNTYLSRSPSYRMTAEMIRDNALAASGLLVRKVGGPSVKPYQPKGVWDVGVLVSGPYTESTGEDLYRRSMYTYIRRTSPHPAMVVFDAPNRLVCTAKRENTNTPLQALVLLNDPQFVEAARVLAARMLKEGGVSLEDQLIYGFRLLCGREPEERELSLLADQFQKAYTKFNASTSEANELLSVGEYPLPLNMDKSRLAAMTGVANALMGFDEVYIKR